MLPFKKEIVRPQAGQIWPSVSTWSSPDFDRTVLSKMGSRRKRSHTNMSSNAERVEIYSGIQRRRGYSVDEKLRIVQEASRPGITISYVAR